MKEHGTIQFTEEKVLQRYICSFYSQLQCKGEDGDFFNLWMFGGYGIKQGYIYIPVHSDIE